MLYAETRPEANSFPVVLHKSDPFATAVKFLKSSDYRSLCYGSDSRLCIQIGSGSDWRLIHVNPTTMRADLALYLHHAGRHKGRSVIRFSPTERDINSIEQAIGLIARNRAAWGL